jgi:hypothetical protein
MGEKGRVSDSEVTRPLVRSAARINLPWPILPLHGRSDRELHKIDGLMDAVYCHLRDYEVREESKRKQEAIGKNYAVKLQSQQVTQSHEQKFAEKTLLKREDKKGILTIIKKERRSLLSTY